jgi:predicted MPP superfamily phosphohydrolase
VHALRLIPFTIAAALLVGWAHVYLYRRLFRDTSANPRWRRAGRLVLWALALSAIGARLVAFVLPRGVVRPIQGVGWFWLALAIYLLLTLAALDAVRGIWRLLRRAPAERHPGTVVDAESGSMDLGPLTLTLSRSREREFSAALAPVPVTVPELTMKGETLFVGQALGASSSDASLSAAPVKPDAQGMARRVFLARAAGAGALAVAGGASAFGIFRAYYPPAVTEVPIRLRGLPRALDGFTIVQLSDVHTGVSVQEAWMGELADRCAALRPDLFVITGDLVDGPVSQLGGVVAHLQKVQAREGTWFVTGNHDYYAGADAWCTALHKMGVQVLRNRRVPIGGGPGAPSFDLIGVDDYGQTLRGDGTGYDLDRAVEGRDPDRPAVLLAHRPNDFDRLASLGLGLQLSGHTHGGQTFPFTAVARLIWPRCAGLFENGDARMYVSRGVGFVGPPLRAGSPPEIVRITLLA